jgi:transaldolase
MISKSLNKLNIKIFADGADINTFKLLYKDPLIKGFTTNPTLMRNQGINNYETFARDILNVVKDKPVSFEIFADDSDSIIKQAKFISSWSSNVYVKIPVTNTHGNFLGSAIRSLSDAGIKLNITAVFTSEQVSNIVSNLNKNTPSVISIFSGRIADSGIDPIKHFKECTEKIKTRSNIQLLWASPRELFNIYNAEEAGADIITVSQDLINKFKNIGKDLSLFSKETVQMFYNDAKAAKYNLNIN